MVRTPKGLLPFTSCEPWTRFTLPYDEGMPESTCLHMYLTDQPHVLCPACTALLNALTEVQLMATKCICVIRNDNRFAHAHCTAFHALAAVGWVTDPVTLDVKFFREENSKTKAQDHIARLQRTHLEVSRLIHGNVTTAEFEGGLANALCELMEVMLGTAAGAAADHASDTAGPTTKR